MVAQTIKKSLPAVQETQVRSLGQEEPLEAGMATHSSILAWRISQTEEPGRLQPMGLQRVGHDWATNAFILFSTLDMYWVCPLCGVGCYKPVSSCLLGLCLSRSSVLCVCSATQSYLTTGDPMDCSRPGSSVHGILQARILEWVAMPASRGSS